MNTEPESREETIRHFVEAYAAIASRVLDVNVERLEIQTEDNPNGGIMVWILLDGQYVTDEKSKLVDETIRTLLGPSN